jgi:thiopeptide-type bacteriocin biosynthesis protein
MEQPYRHLGVALLRAAVRRADDQPVYWPDPSDAQACATWLTQVWADEQVRRMIGQASPVLAGSVASICRGDDVQAKRVRSAAISVARYLLRATGRPTPFGLFAGVAPVRVGGQARARWSDSHRAVARPDTEWLATVAGGLESRPELLPQLEVVVSDLAMSCGGWVEIGHATGTFQVRETPVVRAVRDLAAVPVPFGELAAKLAARFGAGQERAMGMLRELAERGLLITNLRAPSTVTDPLEHVIHVLADRARSGQAQEIGRQLTAVRDRLRAHNSARSGAMTFVPEHDELERLMRELAPQARPVLAVDLALDCEVSIPGRVAADAAQAAGVLLRLSRHRDGLPTWRAYHAAFCERYGTGLAVPLTDVANPGTGLGYPAGYPGSVFAEPPDLPAERDQRLLELAWTSMLSGDDALVLTDEMLDAVTGGWQPTPAQIPPHVEVAIRICAVSTQAIDDGDYTIVISPARAGGVLTSRFTPTATGSGLETVYRSLPTAVTGALAVQLSFPPAFAHAENVSRVPAYLPRVLSLGEHRQSGGSEILRIGDLAVTATAERLYLVTRQGQVVEPQVFHALNLDKQPPPLARFLAHISRAFSASWAAFDWGPFAATLPYLPRVRYGRCILAFARWRLQRNCIPPEQADWQAAQRAWRSQVRCPQSVELREDDRTLPLDLDERMHAAILRRNLARHGEAILTEPAAGAGWIGGHAHEIAIPLAVTGPPAPPVKPAPILLARRHGNLPGCESPWLYAKVFAPACWQEEILAGHIPALLAELGDRQRCWFVRYRSAQETDHLRLRLHVGDAGGFARCAGVLGQWASQLRDAGIADRMALDTYYPETGRYGGPTAMPAAEHVFAADSQSVIAALQAARDDHADRVVLAVLGMVQIARGLLGLAAAIDWFAANPAHVGHPVDSAAVTAITALARDGRLLESAGWPVPAAGAAAERTSTLAAYRQALPGDTDIDAVLRSLLHMHHNRLIGIDPDAERTCRYLARRGCLTARACAGIPP